MRLSHLHKPMTAPKVNWLDLDSSETIDPHFTEAKQAIGKYVGKVGECTVGTLKRKFPKFVHLILDVIGDLKLEGKIDFDEHSPPPTIVRIGSMRRVHEPQYKSTATHREKNKEPFSPLDATI